MKRKDWQHVSQHFINGRFENQHPPKHNMGFAAYLKVRCRTPYAKWPKWIETEYAPAPPERNHSNDIHITHINHSTVLVQTAGLNILTDPIYSKRCSPFAFAGPKRVQNPGVRFADLPPIDIVLLSHNHYDHLDRPTLKMLMTHHQPTIITGLGVNDTLKGISTAIELDWWETLQTLGIKVSFTPTQHFSARWTHDHRKTLWGAFVIETSSKKIYFGGDSGYANHYTQTYEKFGAMDLSLLPIGAYEPRSFMKYVHMNPEEAVQAHIDLHSKRSFGIHHSTFQLTAEDIDEPKRALAIALKAKNIIPEDFITATFEEQIVYS